MNLNSPATENGTGQQPRKAGSNTPSALKRNRNRRIIAIVHMDTSAASLGKPNSDFCA